MILEDDGSHHKRKRNDDQPSAIIACSKCGLVVPSRNQLFLHLRSSITCSFENNNEKKVTEATPWKKIVMVVAYLGNKYHGSARNDPRDSLPTVEGCLWKATAQALPEKNNGNGRGTGSFLLQVQQNTNPKAMTRSSRTDKGVSSLGTVYSLLLPNLLNEDASFASAINHHLPDDIRVLRILGTTIPQAFNARTCCETRRYRYVIPVAALCVRNTEQQESTMDVRKRLKPLLLQWGGTHSFHNFTKWSGRPKQKRPQNKNDVEDDQNSTSCIRHIVRCHVEDVVRHDGVEFVVISIKGESFLYHQIRKMMGTTIGIMNRSLPPEFIAGAFEEDHTTMEAPLAPAEGLVLVECVYSKYCSKHQTEPIGLGTKLLSRDSGKDGSADSRLSTDWEAAAVALLKDTREFQKRIYAHMFKTQAVQFSGI